MKGFTFSLLVLLFCCGACSRQSHPVQSVGVVAEQDGTVTVRSTGYGKNKGEAIDAAERNAIELLLFRGVPGSQQAMPLVSIDESSARSRYKRYFEELLDEERHKTFILSSVPVSNFVKHDQTRRNITVDVRINLPALRSDLETQGVIRKFGY